MTLTRKISEIHSITLEEAMYLYSKSRWCFNVCGVREIVITIEK